MSICPAPSPLVSSFIPSPSPPSLSLSLLRFTLSLRLYSVYAIACVLSSLACASAIRRVLRPFTFLAAPSPVFARPCPARFLVCLFALRLVSSCTLFSSVAPSELLRFSFSAVDPPPDPAFYPPSTPLHAPCAGVEGIRQSLRALFTFAKVSCNCKHTTHRRSMVSQY